jgi:2-desacetyl-2-hydroxyethyl bacteriochlorophyllide A dehydrogenase
MGRQNDYDREVAGAMEARALICDEDQNFEIRDVTLTDPASDQIAIRTHFSGVSIGTEFALIRNKLSWGPFPICPGYQGTGIVVEVGSEIKNFAEGDDVYYRKNDSMTLKDGNPVTCASGGHCSHVVLNPNTTHGAGPIGGASLEAASQFVMPAVALNGVDMANPRMGDTVVVHGTGLIGLGVVAACAQRGCVVIAVDVAAKPLEIARRLGADHTIDGAKLVLCPINSHAKSLDLSQY